MASVIAVNNQDHSASPLPFSGKKKKWKSQTTTLTLPKSKGPKASGALSKKRNKPKSKKTTPKAQVTPPIVPTEDYEKTQSEFHSPPDEGTRRSHPFPEGKSTDAKDPEGNIQPVGKALPSTSLDEDIPRFEVSVPDQNKGKTSYEKELGNQPLILSTSADVQALLLSDEELMKESKDDVFKAGDEIDKDIHHTDEEETQNFMTDLQKISGKNMRKQLLHMLILIVKLKDFIMLLTKFIKALKLSATHMRSPLSSSKLSMEDEINSMMTDIFKTFNGQSYYAPSTTVPTTTLAITEGLTTVRRRIMLTLPMKNLILTLKIYNLTNDEIQEYLNKEERIKIKAKEARLLAMTKSELINVVHKEAEKAEIDPKIIESVKGDSNLIYDRKNFDVHNPFKFANFRVTELDELDPIIEKKKKKISSVRKRTRTELEPEIRIPSLKYNMSLPEGVPFVNNMVIEEPEYVMFFTDVFGDEAFQR
nr:hypothetical protein [Tanacetum cinerariifolium]